MKEALMTGTPKTLDEALDSVLSGRVGDVVIKELRSVLRDFVAQKTCTYENVSDDEACIQMFRRVFNEK